MHILHVKMDMQFSLMRFILIKKMLLFENFQEKMFSLDVGEFPKKILKK